MKATHQGWFLFCPVYVDMTNPEIPEVCARWPWLEWLMDPALWCQEAAIMFLSLTNPDYEPAFSIRLTGELPAGGASKP